MAGRPGRSGGHNRLSPAEHLLRGTFNPTRHGSRAAALLSLSGRTPPARGELTPPAWLDDDAKAEWQRLAPVLGRLGVLTETDADALCAYCEAWTTWKQATQKVRQFGMVITGKRDEPMMSPYVKIAHQALTQMRALLSAFGMTPSARAGIRLPEPAKPPNRFAGNGIGGRAAVSKWPNLL